MKIGTRIWRAFICLPIHFEYLPATVEQCSRMTIPKLDGPILFSKEDENS